MTHTKEGNGQQEFDSESQNMFVSTLYEVPE